MAESMSGAELNCLLCRVDLFIKEVPVLKADFSRCASEMNDSPAVFNPRSGSGGNARADNCQGEEKYRELCAHNLIYSTPAGRAAS